MEYRDIENHIRTAQQEAAQRFKEARETILPLLPKQPYAGEIKAELIEATGYSKRMIRRVLSSVTSNRNYMQLLADKTFCYHLDGRRTKIPDKAKDQARLNLDNWTEIQRHNAAQAAERYASSAANKERNRVEWETRQAKKCAKSPSKRSEAMRPVIASPTKHEAGTQSPVKPVGVIQPKRRRVLSLKGAAL